MRIEACFKTFGAHTVLRFPGLTLAPGRLYAIVGANGSGKSTFAKLVAGVLPADRNIRVLPDPVKVRYMPQKSYAFHLTTKGNILLTGGGKEQAEELMEALQIGHFSRQRATSLSGGETAKMALVRVLMQPCELLILDEPTAAMDMESAMLAEKLIETYCKETSCTVLLITHDLQQARRMAEEALFFFRGQLWEAGSAKTVLFAPERPETRRFLEFYGGPQTKEINHSITRM